MKLFLTTIGIVLINLIFLVVFFLGFAYFILSYLAPFEKCCKLRRTEKIGTDLYIEHYLTMNGGVLGGEMVDCYLTDSSTFRQHITKYDEHIFPEFAINNNILKIFTICNYYKHDTLEHTLLSINDLVSISASKNNSVFPISESDQNKLLCDTLINSYIDKISNVNSNVQPYYFQVEKYQRYNNWVDACYISDSLNFKLLVGIIDPQKMVIKINRTDSTHFEFLEIKYQLIDDTVKTESYDICKLKNSGFVQPCQ